MHRIIKDPRSSKRVGGDERRAAGTRQLSLRRETLRELTTPELHFAAGRSPSSTFAPEI
jgi:hypothetical protein